MGKKSSARPLKLKLVDLVVQFMDGIVDEIVQKQRQVPMTQQVQKTVEVPEIQYIDVPRTKPAKKVHFDDKGDQLQKISSGVLKDDWRNAGYTSQDEFLVEQMEQQMNPESFRSYIKCLEGLNESVDDVDGRNAGYISQDEFLVEQMEQQMEPESFRSYIECFEGLDESVDDVDGRNAGYTSQDEFLVEQMEQQMDPESFRSYIKFLEGSDESGNDIDENFEDLCAKLAKVKMKSYTEELNLLDNILDSYIKCPEVSDESGNDVGENFEDLCAKLAKVKMKSYTEELNLLDDILDGECSDDCSSLEEFDDEFEDWSMREFEGVAPNLVVADG